MSLIMDVQGNLEKWKILILKFTESGRNRDDELDLELRLYVSTLQM